MREILLSVCRGIYRIFSGSRLRRFYPVRIMKDFIVSRLRKNYAEVDGHKMFLDPQDTFCLSIFGVYEPYQTELVKKVIRKGDVVLDIGANLGYYTLILARLVGDKGKVYAFEPDPNNFALLEKNVKINGYKNVILVNRAVSDKNGKTRLYLSKDCGSHSLGDFPKANKFIEVETVRLDDYFKDYRGKFDFIKMDIEGAEGLAVRGMPLLLQNNEYLEIIMEFRPSLLKLCGIDARQLLDLLAASGFKFYNLNEGKKRVEEISAAELLKNYSAEQDIHTNLLCKKAK